MRRSAWATDERFLKPLQLLQRKCSVAVCRGNIVIYPQGNIDLTDRLGMTAHLGINDSEHVETVKVIRLRFQSLSIKLLCLG